MLNCPSWIRRVLQGMAEKLLLARKFGRSEDPSNGFEVCRNIKAFKTATK